MKENIYITGYSMVTSLGNNRETWESLCIGRSAVSKVKHFSTDTLDFHDAACIPDLWENVIDDRVWELQKRSLDNLANIPRDSVVIWAGVKSNVGYLESGGKQGNPAAFQYCRKICEYLDLDHRGSMSVNAACASSTVAVAIGSEMIKHGECNNVLVCASDIVSRFVFMGFAALKALTPTTCRPFDANRDGLVLGDGAISILLSGSKPSQNYDNVARVAGWGISNDATHITGPSRDGDGLCRAIEDALNMAVITSNDVEAYCAHGTGTSYNDAMELHAMKRVFGDTNIPVCSVKGAIGHTLGAGGAIEIALCVEAMHNKKIPPTLGLRDVEPMGLGNIQNRQQEFEGNTMLTTNSGFGGINAAIILQKD